MGEVVGGGLRRIGEGLEVGVEEEGEVVGEVGLVEEEVVGEVGFVVKEVAGEMEEEGLVEEVAGEGLEVLAASLEEPKTGGRGLEGLEEANARAVGGRVVEEAGEEESFMGEEDGVRASRLAGLTGRGFLT